jgi:phosphatidate cytidylyltransferase
MSRALTGALLALLALVAVFRLSGWYFLLFVMVLVEIAAIEYVYLTDKLTRRRVMWCVPLLAPVVASLLLPGMLSEGIAPGDRALALAFLAAAGAAVFVLFSRSTLEETVSAIGLSSFGVLYFAAPIAAVVRLQAADPWLVVLVLAIVAAGDTAAYYIGTAFGRHKLAPIVSPNKSWEGAAASLVAATMAAAVWSLVRRGDVEPGFLLVAAATSMAAQIGDLVESTLKRRAGVKDSGRLLPGHGGMMDRLDALLFAAPVLVLGLRLLGWDVP